MNRGAESGGPLKISEILPYGGGVNYLYFINDRLLSVV